MSLSTKQSTLFVFRELIEPHKVPSDTYFPENTSLLIGFAEDAHARQSSNKFDLCTHSTASFLIPNSSFQRNVGLKVNLRLYRKRI